jgi:RNA 2',3'-cyclic 3'-phosphodiesterase
VRAFLAVPVRPPADRPVRDLVEALRTRVAGVRWVDTTTTHVTLHFFAELPQSRVAQVVGEVRSAVSPAAPFPLRPGGAGSFPSGARARVLWLGLGQDSLALAELAAAVQAAVAGCGFEVDRRPFRAHITLGRPGPRFDSLAWAEQLAEIPSFPEFVADRVVLYESREGHHVREVFPLGAGPAWAVR